MYKLYSVIAALSVFVRQFVLPNPFEPLGENFTLSIKNVGIPLTPEIANWIAEPILHIITFAIVGIYYSRGKNEPALGSFLYLLFYTIHVGLIHIVSCFYFTWAAIIITLFVYVAVHIVVNVLRNQLMYRIG